MNASNTLSTETRQALVQDLLILNRAVRKGQRLGFNVDAMIEEAGRLADALKPTK